MIHNEFGRQLKRSSPISHVVKRTQGSSDFDLDRLVTLCPPCHAQTDAPYARGRLVITALGQGRFTFGFRGSSTELESLAAHVDSGA